VEQVIRRIHAALPEGLTGQLDVSPRPGIPRVVCSRGPSTTTAQAAIIDNVVKRPMKDDSRHQGSAI